MENINENNDVISDVTSCQITGLAPIDLAFMQIQGLREGVINGEYQLVPTHYNSKVPIQSDDGVSWLEHFYTLTELYGKYYGSGVGLKNGKLSNNTGCIDIDGVGEGEEKIKSIQLIYEALKGMSCFKYCIVIRTARFGIHILYKFADDSEIVKPHRLSQRVYFPLDCGIPGLAGKRLGNGIEIFDGRKELPNGDEGCNRQTLMFAEIDGNPYEVISEQNDIRKLPIVEDIEKEVEEALLLAGFTIDTDYSKIDSNECEYKRGNGIIPIPNENIVPLAKFLSNLYRQFHELNCKFNATQCLAGYLARHTDYDSAVKLGKAINDEVGHLFDSRKTFFTTLLNDFNKPNFEDINAQGGNKFYMEYCKDFIDVHVFWETMVFLMGGNMEFCLGDRSAQKRDFIVLNREEGKVILNTYTDKKEKNGTYSLMLNTSRNILGFCPVSLERVFNPLNPMESKLVLHYVSNFGDNEIVAKNSDSLLSTIKLINGAVLNKNNFADVLNQTINKFYELNLVRDCERSSLPGVFIIGDKLLRYDVNGEKVPIAKPDSAEIDEALSLIENMIQIIPHKNGEIGLLLRKAFLYPFHFHFKSKNRQVKYILLSGVGSTLKSTLGEMCLSIYQKVIRNGNNSNVIGGGSFDTEYRIANAMGKSGMGFLVNEPDAAFTNPSLMQILKVCTTDLIAREPNGVKMYAYQSPIFATNIDLPNKTEFIRRQDDFNFTPTYVVDEKVLEDLASLLNVDGVQNKKFENLHVIGDFILYFISKDLSLLDLSYDDLELRIVEALEEVSDKDLSWMKMSKFDLGYGDEESDSLDDYDNVMDLFIRELKRIYNANQSSCILLNKEIKSDMDSIQLYDEDTFKILIRRGHYDFLTLLKSDNEFIIIMDKPIHDFFNSHGISGIRGKQFYEEYLTPFEVNYDSIKHGNHRPYDRKQVKGTRVPISFIMDLINGGAYD